MMTPGRDHGISVGLDAHLGWLVVCVVIVLRLWFVTGVGVAALVRDTGECGDGVTALVRDTGVALAVGHWLRTLGSDRGRDSDSVTVVCDSGGIGVEVG
jgi:hypothetical protein